MKEEKTTKALESRGFRIPKKVEKFSFSMYFFFLLLSMDEH